MATANDVATYLTHLAQHSGEEPDPLTHLRLQKLLYYVQGWSLALRGTPMFPDRIEAWANGPVVPTLFQGSKAHGANPVELAGELPDLDMTDEERTFVAEVWDEYKPFAALKLREMTHNEKPWVDAHQGYGPADLCRAEIAPAVMHDFFAQLAGK